MFCSKSPKMDIYQPLIKHFALSNRETRPNSGEAQPLSLRDPLSAVQALPAMHRKGNTMDENATSWIWVLTWGFPEIGVPPNRWIFPPFMDFPSQTIYLGYPHDYGNSHIDPTPAPIDSTLGQFSWPSFCKVWSPCSLVECPRPNFDDYLKLHTCPILLLHP